MTQNREERLATRRAWAVAYPDRIALHRSREKAKMTREKRRQRWLKSMAKPAIRAKAIAQQYAWHKAHPERGKLASRKCHQKRSQNPKWVVAGRLRARIYDALQANKCSKKHPFRELVGCSLGELRFWIEGQFKPGMNWDKRSEWHIDHKIPVAAFDLTMIEQQRACFHYTNLQPLWKAENLAKGKKLIPFTIAA